MSDPVKEAPTSAARAGAPATDQPYRMLCDIEAEQAAAAAKPPDPPPDKKRSA
jgi:hypothetical protein